MRSIWKKMPENWSTMSGRTARSSTTTEAAFRWSRSSPSRICARRKRLLLIWKNCVWWFSISAHPTVNCRRARCVPMSTFRSVRAEVRNSEHVPRWRTWTPLRPSEERSRESVQDRSSWSRKEKPLSRRPAAGTTTKSIPTRCVRKRMRRITATSRTRICRRCTFPTSGSTALWNPCRNSSRKNRHAMWSSTDCRSTMRAFWPVPRSCPISLRRRRRSAANRKKWQTGWWARRCVF